MSSNFSQFAGQKYFWTWTLFQVKMFSFHDSYTLFSPIPLRAFICFYYFLKHVTHPHIYITDKIGCVEVKLYRLSILSPPNILKDSGPDILWLILTCVHVWGVVSHVIVFYDFPFKFTVAHWNIVFLLDSGVFKENWRPPWPAWFSM